MLRRVEKLRVYVLHTVNGERVPSGYGGIGWCGEVDGVQVGGIMYTPYEQTEEIVKQIAALLP